MCLTADGELVLLHEPWLPFGTDLEGWAHERTAAELRRARLAGGEQPLFVDDLSAAAPRDLVLQFEVKCHADPELATRTVEALAAVLARAEGRRVEVLSFASAACARAAALGLPARLVMWADYAPRALAGWARRHHVVGVCVEHFVLSRALVASLRRGGLSVTTGTVPQRRGAAAPRGGARRRRRDDRRSRGPTRAARGCRRGRPRQRGHDSRVPVDDDSAVDVRLV